MVIIHNSKKSVSVLHIFVYAFYKLKNFKNLFYIVFYEAFSLVQMRSNCCMFFIPNTLLFHSRTLASFEMFLKKGGKGLDYIIATEMLVMINVIIDFKNQVCVNAPDSVCCTFLSRRGVILSFSKKCFLLYIVY